MINGIQFTFKTKQKTPKQQKVYNISYILLLMPTKF